MTPRFAAHLDANGTRTICSSWEQPGSFSVQRIVLETTIEAPPERCFLLSLSVDLHLKNMAYTGERAIAGVTSGVIGPGGTVTWQGRHFGYRFKHQALIAEYDRPRHFRDVMTSGAFRSFEHDHDFTPLTASTTLMRDDLRFAAPLGPLGRLAEEAVLRRYLTRLLMARNRTIRSIAEGSEDVWGPLLRSNAAIASNEDATG